MEKSFYENAAVAVFHVAIEIQQSVDGIHGYAGAFDKPLAFKEMGNEHGRKEVACAMEQARYLFVL